MAAVTLGDLMNPLTKLEKISQETLDAVYTLSDFIVQRTISGQKIQNQLLKLSEIQTGLLVGIEKNTSKSLFQAIVSFLAHRRDRKELIQYRKDHLSLLGKMLNVSSGRLGDQSGLDPKGTTAIGMLGRGVSELATGLIKMAGIKKPQQKALERVLLFVKDLIVKIGKENVKSLKEGGEALFNLGEGILKFSKSLALSLLFIIPGMFALPFLAVSIFTLGGIVTLFGKQKDAFKEGSESLSVLARGIRNFSIAVFISTLALGLSTYKAFYELIAIITLTSTVAILIGKLGEPIRIGSKAIADMGGGLMKFVLTLALISLSLMLKGAGFAEIALLTTLIVGFGLAFSLIGKHSKNISKGIKVMNKIKSALISFAIGLVALTLAALPMILFPPLLPILVGTLFGFAYVFKYLGEVDAKKGATSLILMGISLSAFALGYSYFSAVTSNLKLYDVATQLFLLAGMVGVLYLAGKMGIKDIALGAVAIALLGPALWAFGWGYAKFAKATEGLGFKEVGVQLLALGGVIVISLIAGFGMSAGALPALGAVAIALLGPALWVFGWGYAKFAKATEGLGFKEVGVQLLALGGIVVISLIAGVGIVLSALGAVAIALLGPALWAFSWGYAKFAKATEGLGFKEVGVQLLALGGVVAISLIAGPGIVFSSLGAVAIALLGPALWAFSWGYAKFAKETEDITLDKVTNQLALLGGLVLVTSLAGLAIPLVVLGVVSLGLISLGIYALSFGLKKYKEIGWGMNDTQGLKGTIHSLLETFGASVPSQKGGSGGGGGGGLFSFLGDIGRTMGNIIKGGLGALSVVANVISVVMISGAILALAKPLSLYKKIGWSMDDTFTITYLFKSLLNTFGAGENAGMLSTVKSFFGSGSSAAKGGSFLAIAEAITQVAKALQEYGKANWSIGKTNILTDSLDRLALSLANFDETLGSSKGLFSNTLKQLKNSPNTLSKAADGFQKVADAINSIDENKAALFNDLFFNASRLGANTNDAALEALVDAIKEIRDTLAGEDGGGGGGVINGIKNFIGGGDSGGNSGGGSNARLNATLSRIDSTLSRLPSQIQAIKIEVSPDYN